MADAPFRTPLRETWRFYNLPVLGAIGWIIYGLGFVYCLVGLVDGTAGSSWPIYVVAPLGPLGLLFWPLATIVIGDEGVRVKAGFKNRATFSLQEVSQVDIVSVSFGQRLQSMIRQDKEPMKFAFLGRRALAVSLKRGGSILIPIKQATKAAEVLAGPLNA